MNKKPIQIAWAPNVEADDLWLAFRLLLSPWKWFGQTAVSQLNKQVSNFVGVEVSPFDSGRSALFEILNTLGIGKGDEILLQSFTCVALPNPILWTGARPVWVDVDLDNLNLSIEDLESKITDKSRAVVVQYTFGICPNILKIVELCKKYNLLLIEDCCHNFGQEIDLNGTKFKAGTIGDASIFSFGMEKVLSATRGGFGWIRDEILNDRLREKSSILQKPRLREVVRGILNPIVWKVKERMGFVGGLLYKLAIKLKVHELGLTKAELIGQKADWLPYQMPNSNAILGLNQLSKFSKFANHRRWVANEYAKLFEKSNGRIQNGTVVGYRVWETGELNEFAPSTHLRYPILIENAQEFRLRMEEDGVYLGNWYTEVIHCKDVDMNCMLYQYGSCPNAEWLVKRIVNLPTHIGIGQKEVKRIVELFDSVPQ